MSDVAEENRWEHWDTVADREYLRVCPRCEGTGRALRRSRLVIRTSVVDSRVGR